MAAAAAADKNVSAYALQAGGSVGSGVSGTREPKYVLYYSLTIKDLQNAPLQLSIQGSVDKCSLAFSMALFVHSSCHDTRQLYSTRAVLQRLCLIVKAVT